VEGETLLGRDRYQLAHLLAAALLFDHQGAAR
jgi:hypothetical protein